MIDDCVTGEKSGAGLGSKSSKEGAKGGREGACVQAALQSLLGKTRRLVGCIRFGSASRATKGSIRCVDLEKGEQDGIHERTEVEAKQASRAACCTQKVWVGPGRVKAGTTESGPEVCGEG